MKFRPFFTVRRRSVTFLQRTNEQNTPLSLDENSPTMTLLLWKKRVRNKSFTTWPTHIIMCLLVWFQTFWVSLLHSASHKDNFRPDTMPDFEYCFETYASYKNATNLFVSWLREMLNISLCGSTTSISVLAEWVNRVASQSCSQKKLRQGVRYIKRAKDLRMQGTVCR